MVPLPTNSGRLTWPMTSARVRTMPITSAVARMTGSTSLTGTTGPQPWAEAFCALNTAAASAAVASIPILAIAFTAVLRLYCSLILPIMLKRSTPAASTRGHGSRSWLGRLLDPHILCVAAVAGAAKLLRVLAELLHVAGLARVVGGASGRLRLGIKIFEIL